MTSEETGVYGGSLTTKPHTNNNNQKVFGFENIFQVGLDQFITLIIDLLDFSILISVSDVSSEIYRKQKKNQITEF